MEIHKTEIFGPVVVILKADNLDDAIKIINEHQYGNRASIYTQNGYWARKFKLEVECGMFFKDWLRNVGYNGWYIIDFYPYREDGVKALSQCIEKTRRFHELAGRLKDTDIEKVQKRHDAIEIYKLLWREIIRR